jgi:proline dehydrogenase
MIQSAAKALFHTLARSTVLKQLAAHYGMRKPASFARRFVAGETIAEAIEAARRLESQGFMQTLDFLGEGVRSLAAAEGATREYLEIVGAVERAGIGRNLSLKLTQLGLDVDRATTAANLRRILDRAQGFFVRIDMESSQYTEVTLELFEALWGLGYRQTGVVLQSELFRTEKDIRRVMALGARIRLVKGAYLEPASVAYKKKEDVDAAYIRQLELLLADGHYPAIATHDPAMIEHAKRFAAARGIGQDRFEFQMLYGIRRDLQAALAQQGYRLRVYTPFGREWFPYFMRRVGERPANLLFVARSLLADRAFIAAEASGR